MLITKIELTDFGPHRKLVEDALGPVVGLIGPNGSGKSNILAAVELAFTGKLRDNADTYVRGFGEEDGANNGSVYIEFLKNGQPGSIMRRVGKSPKRELVWNGQKVTRAKEVDELMSDILGADKLALANAIFINQGELDRLLFGVASERQELFTRLLLISYVEQRQHVVDNKIKSLSEGVQDFTAMLDEALAGLRGAQITVRDLEAVRANLRDYTPDIELWQEYDRRLKEKETRQQQCQSLQQSVVQTEGRLRSLMGDQTLEQLDHQLDQLEEAQNSLYISLSCKEDGLRHTRDRQRLEQDIKTKDQELQRVVTEHQLALGECKTRDEMHQALSAAQDDIRRLQEWQQADREVRRLETETGQAQAQTEALTPPTKTKDQLEALRTQLDMQAQELATTSSKLQTLREARELADRGSDGDCPVCGNSLSDSLLLSEENLLQLRQQMAELQTQRQALQSEVQQLDNQWSTYEAQYKERMSAWTQVMSRWLAQQQAMPTEPQIKADQTLVDSLTSRLHQEQQATRQLHDLQIAQANLHQQLQAIPKDVVVTEAQVRELREKYQVGQAEQQQLGQQRRQLQEASAELEQARARAQAGEDQLEQVVTQLTDTQRRVQDNQVIQSLQKELVDYQPVLDKLRDQQREWAEATGRIEQAKKHLDEAEGRKTQIEHRMQEDGRRRQVIDNLRRLRQALAKDGVPSSYIRYRFEQLVEMTQEQLSELDANFMVEQDPEQATTFRFRRVDSADDYWMDQSKLSGGQRVRLTVAFLLAVQRLVLPEVGFLVLDEPSQHMDESGVESLKELLIRLQYTLGNSEAQVMVCDHNPALTTSFSSCIQLKPGGADA